MVAVPAGSIAPVPDGVGVAQAASVGLAGVTALDAAALGLRTHLILDASRGVPLGSLTIGSFDGLRL